jgi:anti-anti-sigma factor
VTAPGVLNLTWSEPEEGTAAVALTGDLDHDTADRLLVEVTDALAGVDRIVLDCAALEFCDSHGLAVLLMIQRRLSACEVELALDNRRPRLDRLFALTGTAELLTGSVAPARSQS